MIHPVIRVHPKTGRKSIYVNPNFTTHILDVSPAESESILSLLYAHISKPEHTLTHRWRNGDLAFWDNRNTAHYANYDYGSFPRIMERLTLQGDQPIGVKTESQGALRSSRTAVSELHNPALTPVSSAFRTAGCTAWLRPDPQGVRGQKARFQPGWGCRCWRPMQADAGILANSQAVRKAVVRKLIEICSFKD